MTTFNLPDVGEGLTEADIVEWKVAVGDEVALNQPFVEIETAKSLVELPCPFEGTVTRLHADVGEVVEVGQPLIDIARPGEETTDDAGDGSAAAGSGDGAGKDGAAGEAADGPGPLVGSGPVADKATLRSRRRRAPQHAGERRAGERGVEYDGPAARAQRSLPGSVGVPALAKPPVRKLARDLGVDLRDVPATGPRGEVTREDLASFADKRLGTYRSSAPAASSEVPRGAVAASFGAGMHNGVSAEPPAGEVTVVPVRGVRKATAEAMVRSAFSAPHVSLFVDVDATRTMEFVRRLKASRDFEGVKVTPLLVVAKAVMWAAQRNPEINSTWVETESDAEIHQKGYINLGIAASTDRGLIVPNIKNADELSLKELAIALNDLALNARDGKTQPADMRDGTISITNVGTLGIDTGTPIINPPEAGIVAFGTVRERPWVVDGAVVPRYVTTVGGSFDHRIVDGDKCAVFLADIAAILEEPALLLD